MTDSLGWRKVFAVIGPSTNTIVQPDMEAMRPPGVTNHYRDIYVEDPEALSDDAFMAGAEKISQGLKDSLRTALTCRPDYLVLGVSAISFMGGRSGAEQFVKEVTEFTGLQISVGSLALSAALAMYPGIKRVAFISPYYPAANAQVTRFLRDSGFEVVRDVPLRCKSWTDIARVGEDRLRCVIRDIDGDDVDAICQVGTNLSMVKLAADAERWLGKPVLAINTATYWHALRTNEIHSSLQDFGSLFSDH